MAKKTWTITELASRTHLESLAIDLAELGAAFEGCSVRKQTLRGGLADGVDVIRVDNGAFRFDVLPTRGMSIWKAWAGDLEIGWKSPNHGPVHPKFVDLGEPGGLGWLDGFDELLVRCGLESNGAPEFDENNKLAYPLHGRVANKPAHHVVVSADGETGEIQVTGVVEETRFHFFKVRMTSTISTRPGQTSFHIRDEIENISASPTEVQMLYHVNFGTPLLDAGSQFVAPLKTVVPRNDHAASGIGGWQNYGAPEPGYEEQVYFMELLADDAGNTRAMLKNAHGTASVSMAFNKRLLPCYTVWKNTTATEDGYVTGLEPGTNFPNPRTYEGEQARVVKLTGGGRTTFDFSLYAQVTAAEVAKEESAIAALQGDIRPRVFDTPQKRWCAPA
ncbi:MAG TPA: DUF4432 domain-containing protein [Planctomycetaceae bacterium]|nr:DUF4432 domain-containing protein [Planctomycetaceae bacterium]